MKKTTWGTRVRSGCLTSMLTLALLWATFSPCVTGSAVAGTALVFDETTDTVQIDGQTIIDTASTYEAKVLFTSEFGRVGPIFNEWTFAQGG